MKTISVGFIGGGRITKIFLQAFKNKNVEFSKIAVFDTNPAITGKLKQLYPPVEISAIEECAARDVVFIALHPPVIMDTLDKIAPFVTSKTTIISLAPKIKMDGIASRVNSPKIVRLIPNATSIINEGYNPVCFSDGLSQQEKTEILELLGLLGTTFEVPEKKLEAYAIISAMAPTYFWFQWKKLSDIGEEIGLSKKESAQTVYQTMISALNTFYNSGYNEQEVIDLIPVKPIGENETEIMNVFDQKLKGLYNKLVS